MTCSCASRLISLVVDGSDDKTTTFTLLLFNFYLVPQASLSITDFSVPLSVFLSVHLSFPFSPLLISFPGAFCLFAPPCHELTTFFLSALTFFYICLSICLPYLYPFNSLIACCRSLCPVKPILLHPHPFIFVLFYPSAFSVCLFITLPSCPCLPLFCSLSPRHVSVYPHVLTLSIPHALLLILTSPLLYSFIFLLIWLRKLLLSMFTFFPSWMLAHRAEVFPHSPFKSLNILSLCPLRRSVIEHWGKLDRES